MAKTDYKTIDQYHSVFPPDTVKRMERIRKSIHRFVPEVEETISYQMPCFKYKGYLLYYAGYAKHISLYYPFSVALLEHFKEELKPYKMSKSAIQFPNKDALPIALINEIIQFRKKENNTLSK